MLEKKQKVRIYYITNFVKYIFRTILKHIFSGLKYNFASKHAFYIKPLVINQKLEAEN